MYKHIYTAIFTMAVFLSCSDFDLSSDPENVIVARVGDQTITVEQFRKDFESGFPHLKKGDDPKRAYLDYMIRERLLSQEGYRLGLDESERVQKSEALLQNELMIERLIDVEVKDKIIVTEEDIKDAINKSKVSFKFRYWVESDHKRANEISDEMQTRGYVDVVDDLLLGNPEKRIRPSDLETDYLTYLEISPEILAAIQSLPRGEISKPVEVEGSYYIFQVMDIRRSGVTTNEYIQKASTFEQIVYHRRFERATADYVSSIMTPKNVVTKGEAFRRLTNALIEWRQSGLNKKIPFKTAVSRATADSPGLFAFRQYYDQPFITMTDEILTTRDFMEILRVDKIAPSKDGRKEFPQAVNEGVAQSLRDHFLLERAHELELRDDPYVKKELGQWRDKWVYEEARNQFIADTKISDDEARKFFEEHIDRYRTSKDQELTFSGANEQEYRRDAMAHKRYNLLSETADGLESDYPVEIFTEVLDTISVIEFEKSKWASLQLYKVGANRPAYPFVDPAWGSVTPEAPAAAEPPQPLEE